MASKRTRKKRNSAAASEPQPVAAPDASPSPSVHVPDPAAFYFLAAIPALAFMLFVLFFGLFGPIVTAGLDRACAEASFVAGKQMEEVGNLEQSVVLYRQALEGRFNDPNNHLLCQRSLGEVLWRLERPGEAIEAFDAMPPDGFQQAGSYTAFVNALVHEGQLERAVTMGQEWLAAAEAEANAQQTLWAHYALGQAHRRLGQHDAALQAFQAAHALEPGSSATLMVAHTLLELGRPDDALAHIEAVIAELPEGRARRDAEAIRQSLQGIS